MPLYRAEAARMILIVSGPIGAGKSAAARELVERIADGVAYIEGDQFWPFIAKESKSQKPPARFTMTIRAMLSAAWHYHRDDYNVIVDFTIPAGYVPAVKKLLRGEPFHYAVIRPSMEVCANRAASRAEGAIADYSRYQDFYAEFYTDDERTIEDDAADPKEIADRIWQGLKDGRFLM